MSLIGRKIIQTRVWVDPNTPPEPVLNYEEVFPITTFDAVRENIADENSDTLRMKLTEIMNELNKKQIRLPAKSPNYLMTFGGNAGEVGAIEMTTMIPWLTIPGTDTKIPTEKAVIDLLFQSGLIDESGKPSTGPLQLEVNWTNVIGRPKMYYTTGNKDDGFMTQRAVTNALENILSNNEELQNAFNDVNNKIDNLVFVNNASYDKDTGVLTLYKTDGSVILIPINNTEPVFNVKSLNAYPKELPAAGGTITVDIVVEMIPAVEQVVTSMDGTNIVDNSITSEKLSNDLILPVNSKTSSNTNDNTAVLRNITISSEDPSGGNDGDIWIKYI